MARAHAGPVCLCMSQDAMKACRLSSESTQGKDSAPHRTRERNVEVGVGFGVDGGDLECNSRVLGAREGEYIYVGRNCLRRAHSSTCHKLPRKLLQVSQLPLTGGPFKPHLPIDHDVEHALPSFGGLPQKDKVFQIT